MMVLIGTGVPTIDGESGSQCDRIGTGGEATLERFRPKAYSETIDGKSVAQAGCRSILHMRHFQQHKCLSDDLVADICGRQQ